MKTVTATDDRCSVETCKEKAKLRGWCRRHYDNWYYRAHRDGTAPTPRRTCGLSYCEKPHAAHDYCSTHLRQWNRTGIVKPIRIPTRRSTSGKYVRIFEPDHPSAYSTGWVAEHIKVMTVMLGRPLLGNENVHHMNGNRHDNRPENLELWLVKQPPGQRVEDVVQWAKEVLSRYEPDCLIAPLALPETEPRWTLKKTA